MTYEMKTTQHDGFPWQYDVKVVQPLNEVMGCRGGNNFDLEDIGRSVSRGAKHRLYGETSDRYHWFGTLEFRVRGARVRMLFPWHQDFRHPDTPMDRSINVYSNKPLLDEVVGELCARVAAKAALSYPRRKA